MVSLHAQCRFLWVRIKLTIGARICRGRLVKDRATGKPKMTCRNWECGVVMPLPKTESVKSNGTQAPDMSIFDGVVPVPMEVPGREYGPKEEPWFYLGGS